MYRVLSPDDDVNVWIIWPHCLSGLGDVLSEFSCVQYCAGCDCLSVAAGPVKLLQEEGNSVVTPSSELHT